MAPTDTPVTTPPAVDVYKFRTKHGLTQEQLGALLGVNRFTVSRWEASIRNIEKPPMLRLALEALERRLMPIGTKERP